MPVLSKLTYADMGRNLVNQVLVTSVELLANNINHWSLDTYNR